MHKTKIKRDRCRLVVLVDPEIREAARVQSSIKRMEMSDFLASILRESLTDAINLLRKDKSKVS